METCTYGLGADIWKPTTERWQGAEYRAYWYNGTPYLFSSSPTRRRRAGEKFFLGTEIHGFIFNKGTAWLRIDIYPRHFVITACFASSRLSLLCGNEPCLYFSIAFMQIKPFPSRSQPCLF